MDTFLKACAAVMIALVLCLMLNKNAKDISLLLSIVVCTMLALTVASFLEPVLDLFETLEQLGELNGDMIRIIVKSVGIGMIGEIASDICIDAGLSAPGKTLRVLAATVILWLSIPLFQTLLELIQEILITP